MNRLTAFKAAPSAQAGIKIPWWTRGETNAFFGLGFNILVNVLTLTSLLIFVVQVPATDVLGTVLPALGIAMLVGNVYYTFLARRLARRENRTDVTALPYGPSVPHMFIVVFVIMLPIFLTTKDPIRKAHMFAGTYARCWRNVAGSVTSRVLSTRSAT